MNECGICYGSDWVLWMLCFLYELVFWCCDGRFVWDEAKYPTMSPLREIVDGIHTQVAKIEDDLKVTISPLCFLIYTPLYTWLYDICWLNGKLRS